MGKRMGEGRGYGGRCCTMKAILYICHGSRIETGCREALDFIDKTKPFIDAPIQEACFLELAAPTIELGWERCIAQGATEIIALPFLLLEAGHAKKDIPNILRKLHLRHPHIFLHCARPIGVHEKIIDILLERMHEREIPLKKDASVLLVGRGSSDKQVIGDFYKIVDLFRYKTELTDVNISFLAAAKPSFKDELHRLHGEKPTQLWVLPYLLFTGILMKSLEKEIGILPAADSVILCNYIGYHPYLRDIIAARIKEAEQIGGNNVVSHYG